MKSFILHIPLFFGDPNKKHIPIFFWRSKPKTYSHFWFGRSKQKNGVAVFADLLSSLPKKLGENVRLSPSAGGPTASGRTLRDFWRVLGASITGKKSLENIWMFPKIGVSPQNGWFVMENPMNKWMIWGAHPYFWKHPYEEKSNGT